MSMILIALSTWLHTLATIVMVGYYLFTGLVFLPVIGMAAVLAVDAWRVRAALAVAARGGALAAGALEAFDAVA